MKKSKSRKVKKGKRECGQAVILNKVGTTDRPLEKARHLASSHQMTRDSISSTGNRRFRSPKARVPDVLKKQQEWSV